MPPLDIAIQIVNYKTIDFLDPLIRSIERDLRDSNLTYEIAILDNDSGDDLSGIAERWPGCRTYQSDKNGGFGYGHNQLAAKTSAQYLLIVNPDTLIIEPSTIARLHKAAVDLNVQAVGPALMSLKSRPMELPLKEPIDTTTMLIPQAWDHGEIDTATRFGVNTYVPRKTRGLVAWVSGAFALIDHQGFDEANGFDENFFLFKEEEDLFLRMRQQSSQIMYDPSVHVLHYGSVVASKDKFFEASNQYFIKKHGAE